MSDDCSRCANNYSQICVRLCAEGSHYQPKPQTNYDRIISKSPEELADWLIGVIQRGSVIPYDETGVTLDWLRKEATE